MLNDATLVLLECREVAPWCERHGASGAALAGVLEAVAWPTFTPGLAHESTRTP